MSLGDAWTETTPGSPSKLNLTNVIFGTGAYLASLDKSKHKLLVCTATGSGFTLDHVYLCSTDGLSVTDLSDTNIHTHTSSTSGGDFINILFDNTEVMDTAARGFSNLTADSTGLYRQSVSGTGAWSTQTDGTTSERYLQASTGATTASTLSTHTPINLNVDWTKNNAFSIKHKINTATSLALKTGIGMENLASADDNTRKYGGEICTTVNSNYFAASANGTTRSSSDTGIAMVTDKDNLAGYFYAGIKFDLYIAASSYTKTSNLPTTSSTNEPSRGAIFRYTVKNNTGADRTFNFYGARIVYSVSDDSGYF